MADLYSQLNVARGASEAEIKKAYRKLAKELHPDKNKDNPKATERFSKVTQAYDILTDKDKRAQYDRGEIDEEGNPNMPFGFGGGPGAGAGRGGGGFRGPNGEPFEFSGGGEAADISDLFEGLFAARRRRRRAVQRLRPPLGAAAEGRRRRLPARGAVRGCGAAQRPAGDTGQRQDARHQAAAGVEDGAKIRLAGQGQPGPAGNGDALVTISIKPHRFFRREGDNIRLDLPVSIDEAALGGKVRVPTVDGPVMLSVPKGSSSGKVLRLKGKGFTGKNGQRGDQLVTLMVDVPDDAELAIFLEGWSGRGKTNPRAGLGV